MSDPLFIEFHIIQSVPPSNINRDDTGSPKTAIFGGVRRARVSSQAWKRATRASFANLLDKDDLGTRTKLVAGLIAALIDQLAPDYASESLSMAVAALKAAGIELATDKEGTRTTGALFFISQGQARALAELAIQAKTDGTPIDKPQAKAALKAKRGTTANNAIDIALFGRMVAEAPELNSDAACQVAHAIGIHRTDPEFDYFTAMDDLAPEDNAGAGMIGTVEFTSSTLYRYATINVPLLKENLNDSAPAVARAVQAFADAFVTSMPTGKQNTFANRTLPAAVLVQLRQTQPVSLVNAFEKPIEPDEHKGRIELACEALIDQENALDEAFGVAPQKSFVILGSPSAAALTTLGEQVSLARLEEALAETIQAWSQS
ncbi:MAG: type I-E CRISPR-associated protein Cas7/Cse4/CasC [Propionibacteriaceae bacterium]|jgi:CRISPR system Cascade subunit CasC|nr:type I-E CRISPR-associated protein Cas7/Cse4/CasC [Propionibacteriaceae bacterium]